MFVSVEDMLEFSWGISINGGAFIRMMTSFCQVVRRLVSLSVDVRDCEAVEFTEKRNTIKHKDGKSFVRDFFHTQLVKLFLT